MMLRLVPATLLATALIGGALFEQSSAAGVAPGSPSTTRAAATAFDPTIGHYTPVQRLPRAAYPKVPTERLDLPLNRVTGEPSVTGRIILKLRDDLGARAPRQAPSDRIFSTVGNNLAAFDAVLAGFGGTVQQWITHRDDQALRALELRAEVRTGAGTPDLASFMVVNVPPDQLLAAGRAFNDLSIVEFVEFERPLVLAQNASCDPGNEAICNLPGPTCMDGYMCNPDPGCQLDPPDCRAGCADVICCQAVTAILPYCNDPDQPFGWDVVCAAYANLICDQTIYDSAGPLPPDQRYDPCFTDGTGAPNPAFAAIGPALSGGCFEPRDARGCNKPSCCFEVCQIDPTCCTISWDSGCVGLAVSAPLVTACGNLPDPGPTPSYAGELVPNPNAPGIGEPALLAGNWQTYLFRQPSAGDFSLPNDPAIPFPALGYRGGGYDLAGLRALLNQFSQLYQDNIEPNYDGRTVRVGIVEFSAFVNHEDFTLGTGNVPLEQPKVISEPGQTIILIEGGANQPEHGTATLGICVAADNGFGVTGIAHQAQGYFFPTLSVEEGSRLPNAIISASETFEDGDILNYSIGFPGAGPIIVSEAVAALIQFLSSLGITSIMSAGNDAIPIEPAPFETGAIVVGACFPGGNAPIYGCTQLGVYHYCRLGFSNFSDPDNEDDLARVHVSGWGTAVATTGYGDLFRGANGTDPTNPETNRLRAYTNAFNGTSAAAPVVAGLAACLQAQSKQFYGSPISPIQLRDVLAGNGIGDQCYPIDPVTLGPGPDDPICNQDIFKDIGLFPDALECGFAIMNGQFVSGNATQIKLVHGTPANSFASFRIRAADGNVLKINTENASAGTVKEGLAYLATGPTTDVIAFLETQVDAIDLQSISLNVASSATKPFVVLGGFLWNYQDSRWDFTGVGFIGPGVGQLAFPVQQSAVTKYLGPSGVVQARVWTCGLGTTGPHQVWHDLIQIAVNAPVAPAP